MDTEIEVKFYPVNKKEIRKILEEAGAKLITPERKMRRVISDYRNNPNIKADYIRVRDEGDLIRLSAKIHAREDGAIKDQKELDLEVGSFEKMTEMFKVMGLKISGYQETLRETWELDKAEIVIDTWPGLKPYIEIEAKKESVVKEVAAKLGLSWENRRITSVTEIFMEVYNINEKKTLSKLSHITFEENPFE